MVSTGTPVSPELDSIGTQVSPELDSIGTQVSPEVDLTGTQASPDCVSMGTQTSPAPVDLMSYGGSTAAIEHTLQQIDAVAEKCGIPLEFRLTIPEIVHGSRISLQHSGDPPPQLHSNPSSSWIRHYSVLSFLLNGRLFAEYDRLSGC